MTIPADLMEALMTLHAEGVLSDHIYHVKDSEGDGWNGPRVKAFGDAVNVIQWYVDKQFDAFEAEDAARDELERITPPSEELLKLPEKFNITGTKTSRFSGGEPNESAPVKDVVFTLKEGARSKVFQDLVAKYFNVNSKEMDLQPCHEFIYLQGGPKWENKYSGRGDWGLMTPLDSVCHYPNGETRCEYVRTDQTWVSPMNGAIHTIFQFERVVEDEI